MYSGKNVPGVRRTVGVVFGFDKTPDICHHVERVSRSIAKNMDCVADEVEMIIHRECPVEISDEVYVQFFDTPEDTGSLRQLNSIDTEDFDV
jgi:hypothetical protein